MSLNYKGLAALSSMSIQVTEEPKMETKLIKTETYQPVENVVGLPKEAVVSDTKKLRMKPRYQNVGMTPIQMAIHKMEMKEMAEKCSDKAYKAWAEATLRRHYAQDENHVTVVTAEEALATRSKTYENPVKVTK